MLFIVSCTSQGSAGDEFLAPLALIETDEIDLVLDKETTSNNSFYQLIDTDSMPLLAFFNPLNSAIYMYNLDNGKFKKRIDFAKEGPNGIGDRITSFNVISKDSILIHSYYKRKIFFMNWQAEAKGELKLYSETVEIAPQTSRGAGLVWDDSWFYLASGNSCLKLKDFQPASIIKVSRDGSGIEEVVSFPDSYLVQNKGYWPKKLCDVFSAYNPEKKSIIYSFPLEEKIIVVNEKGGVEEFDFGIPNFEKQKGLSPSEYPGDPFAEFKAFLGYSRFANIYYDPYRKVYLRSFYKKTPTEMLEENKLVSEKSMIAANDDFEVLGEVDFQGTENLVFGKKGLYQILFDNNVEDTLKIKRYEYGF
ncbi:MAG: DUF4221 family protein [Roseivirga sp.]|nr:DUF4221 family protein [Roseivirga sp.]